MSNESKGLWKRVYRREFVAELLADTVGGFTVAGAETLYNHLEEVAAGLPAGLPLDFEIVRLKWAEFTEQGLIDEARCVLDRSHFEDDDSYFEAILEAHRDAGIEVLVTPADTYLVQGKL